MDTLLRDENGHEIDDSSKNNIEVHVYVYYNCEGNITYISLFVFFILTCVL